MHRSPAQVPWIGCQALQLPPYSGDNPKINKILENCAQGVVLGYDASTYAVHCTRYCPAGVCFMSSTGNIENSRLSRGVQREIFSYSEFLNNHRSPHEWPAKLAKQRVRLIFGTKANERPLVEVQLRIATELASPSNEDSLDISITPNSIDRALTDCLQFLPKMTI